MFAYDNNGNIITKKETEFTLKENTEDCIFTEYLYEYDGDRLVYYKGKTCSYGATGKPSIYKNNNVYWSGVNVVEYGNNKFTYDARGRRLTKNNLVYTYDSNGKLIRQSDGLEFFYDHTGVAGMKYNDATYIYRKDVQGNIIALLDSSGGIVVKYTYDAWGNYAAEALDYYDGKVQFRNVDSDKAFNADYAKYKQLANINPFRYRGYYYDTETELYFLKTRYYDPEVGRFISPDSIEYLDPETINGLNLYAYCNNNPVSNVDPNGNKWWHWFLGVVAVVALAAVVVASAVLTGGTSLVAIGIGFAIGSAASVVTQGISNVINGNNFFQNINIATVLISGLAGAAFATGLGGLAGALGIGVASSVATSAIEEKSIGEILFNGLVGGLSAGLAFGFGQLIGKVVYQANDFVFGTFWEMAKVDGANVVKGALTAFSSSWFKFLPSITPGTTRAILNFLGKKVGGLLNG